MAKKITEPEKLTRVITDERGHKTYIFHPIISEEEREIRFNRFKEAVARFLDEVEDYERAREGG